MRCGVTPFALAVLAGCSRTSSPGKPSNQPSTTAPPAAVAPAPTRPSIEDQPIRTPAFDQKYDWKLQPSELKYLETSRRTKHNLMVSMKAPAGSKVGVAIVLKTDLEFALKAYEMGEEPKNTVALHAGADQVELAAPMPAVLPYAIIVRNFSDQAVSVALALKAQ